MRRRWAREGRFEGKVGLCPLGRASAGVCIVVPFVETPGRSARWGRTLRGGHVGGPVDTGHTPCCSRVASRPAVGAGRRCDAPPNAGCTPGRAHKTLPAQTRAVAVPTRVHA